MPFEGRGKLSSKKGSIQGQRGETEDRHERTGLDHARKAEKVLARPEKVWALSVSVFPSNACRVIIRRGSRGKPDGIQRTPGYERGGKPVSDTLKKCREACFKRKTEKNIGWNNFHREARRRGAKEIEKKKRGGGGSNGLWKLKGNQAALWRREKSSVPSPQRQKEEIGFPSGIRENSPEGEEPPHEGLGGLTRMAGASTDERKEMVIDG